MTKSIPTAFRNVRGRVAFELWAVLLSTWASTTKSKQDQVVFEIADLVQRKNSVLESRYKGTVAHVFVGFQGIYLIDRHGSNSLASHLGNRIKSKGIRSGWYHWEPITSLWPISRETGPKRIWKRCFQHNIFFPIIIVFKKKENSLPVRKYFS